MSEQKPLNKDSGIKEADVNAGHSPRQNEVSWACRFHPTQWFHEVGCPHCEWSVEQLLGALITTKKFNQTVLTPRHLQAETDREELLQCRALLRVQDGGNLWDAISRMLLTFHHQRQGLRIAHDMMQTWFSSEYLEHPQTRLVGAALDVDPLPRPTREPYSVPDALQGSDASFKQNSSSASIERLSAPPTKEKQTL